LVMIYLSPLPMEHFPEWKSHTWMVQHGVEPHVVLTAPVSGHISGTTAPIGTNEGSLES
ncbi:uncharacterized protein EI90DRAFT_3090961, partial [Cantharellus anzutake]|uniref:uncharacterized protein n=1 Tax=Cantharellus anzutake TaxID=1750568 RepID=UPI0019053000